MTHYQDGDLILYYYGEGRRRAVVEAHLEQCPRCADAYRSLAATLQMVAPPEIPERGDQYGLELWQRIRHQLPEQDAPWWMVWLRWERMAVAAGLAVLVVGAFVAGRQWRGADALPFARPGTRAAIAGNDVHRILLTSVADHLDRSERVLTDIMNMPNDSDISAEQRWAEDLLMASRLFRHDAIDAGEQSVAGILDELERSLIEVVHSPSIDAAALEKVRRRIDSAALLFKVRIMSDELRSREQPSDEAPVPASISKIS